MKKIILLFLILFLIPQTVFSANEDVYKTFNVGPGESVNVYIYRLDGQVHAEIKAQGMVYGFLLKNFFIRQNGIEYEGIYSFGVYNAEDDYIHTIYTDEKEYLTIKKMKPFPGEINNLNLSKKFNLVSDYDLDFLTVPAKKSSGGGGGGCFILNLVK